MCNHGFVHPARFIHDKHYVSREEYAPDLWPEYCWGPAYVLTSDTLKPLYNLTKFVRTVPMEDVYVGMLAKKLNMEFVNINDWLRMYYSFDRSQSQSILKKYHFINVSNLPNQDVVFVNVSIEINKN